LDWAENMIFTDFHNSVTNLYAKVKPEAEKSIFFSSGIYRISRPIRRIVIFPLDSLEKIMMNVF
jgi:hypothetical protein